MSSVFVVGETEWFAGMEVWKVCGPFVHLIPCERRLLMLT